VGARLVLIPADIVKSEQFSSSSGPESTNNILALAFGVLIVFLVIAGSLWIIANLNANMMPTFAH
jgi:heme/copper-type cytochrome/quinol oxidase subunit 4